MINEKLLKFWISNNLNVLFIGKHGVGKTSMIIDAFDKAGLKWKYFSASTMDPWTDLCGVPQKVVDEKGCTHLDFIRPREFQNDEVEALFFDEYNRAASKTRNAVMELIQFKSINGKKFNNLKIVWAAINPIEKDSDLKYDVEELDPAQADRFHIKVDVPYKPDIFYFKNKYGSHITKVALEWWGDLPPKVKNEVSPRRLDYALNIHGLKGDMRYCLPKESNVSKLIKMISNGSYVEEFAKLYNGKDKSKVKEFLASEENYYAVIDNISKDKEVLLNCLPLLDKEKIVTLMCESKHVIAEVVAKKDEKLFQDVIEQIKLSKNKKLSKEVSKLLPKNPSSMFDTTAGRREALKLINAKWKNKVITDNDFKSIDIISGRTNGTLPLFSKAKIVKALKEFGKDWSWVQVNCPNIYKKVFNGKPFTV